MTSENKAIPSEADTASVGVDDRFLNELVARSRISTGHGTCESNGFPAGVIFRWWVHEGRAPW